MPAAPAPAGSGRNRWLVLVAMTGSLSMIMLDQTVVTVALPSMAQDLRLSPTGQQWVVNAYVLAMSALVAVGGRLGDQLGGVRTFRIGVVTFFVGSVGCGLAPTALGEPWIVACRVLQGVGAALMTPVSGVIVLGAFGVAERGRAMALYGGISQVFLAIGPLIGGVLTQAVSWRAVFWLNVPVGVAALVLVRIARPADVRRPGRIRPVPVLLLVTGLGTAVLAVQEAARRPASFTVPVLVAGLALTTVFVMTQSRSADPLVDVRLLRRRPFLGDVAVNGLTQFALLAAVLYGSLALQEVLDLSPVRTGVAVLVLIVPFAVANQIGGWWYDRSGVRPPALTGLAIATCGLAAWTVALPALSYAAQVPGMVLAGLGLGLVVSPTTTDALGRVEPGARAQASGLLQTVRQVGGTLGVAVVGAVVLAREPAGSGAADPARAATAIAAGFAVATAAFVLALGAGWWLLSGTRVTEPAGPVDVPA